MRVFVTGATGFVGSHVCDALADAGHVVYPLVRKPDKARAFKVPGTYVTGSLAGTGTNDWLAQLPDDLDAVIHCAGQGGDTFDPRDFQTVNVDAARTLVADLASRWGDTPLRFVHVGSFAAVGPRTYPADEREPLRPVSAYGRSKAIGERLVRRTAPAAWRVTVVRPPTVLGPRSAGSLSLYTMVANGRVFLPGPGALRRPMSFIAGQDLARLLQAVMEAPDDRPPPPVLHAAHPVGFSSGELLDTIRRVLGVRRPHFVALPVPLLHLAAWAQWAVHPWTGTLSRLTPDKLHELIAPGWACSGALAERSLGFRYRWGLEATVRATCTDYQERGWLPGKPPAQA